MAAASRQSLKRIMSPCKQTCSLLFLSFRVTDYAVGYQAP